MTCPSWVAPHGMAHSFIESDKAVVHVIRLVRFLWFWFSVCLPSDGWWWRKRPWCWQRLKVGGEGDDRGWDGWMPSLTQWAWVWVNFGSWWWTGRLGVLQSMGLQRVRCNLVTPSSLMGPLCIFFWCMEKFGSGPFIKELSIICLFFHSFTHSFLLEIFMVSTLMPGTLLGARIPRHTQGPHLCLLSAEELTRKLPILLHRWTDLTKSSPFPHF